MTNTSAPLPLKPQPGFFARIWADPDGRSTIVGVAGVILVYLILGVSVPYLSHLGPPQTFTPPAKPKPKQFQIRIAENTFTKPKEKQKQLPNRFVETNPDAPRNIPDKTTNFAAQDQQVAQEKAAVQKDSDMPSTQGKKDFESNQIVSGQLVKPVEQVEAVPPAEVTPPREQIAQQPRLEQNPFKGFENKQGESKDGFATRIAAASASPKLIPQKIEGLKDVPFSPDATAVEPMVDPSRPRPRPSLTKTQQVRPAILAERVAGTDKIGNIAVDARWSNYGAYLQRMIETVQIQWERILGDSKVYPPAGSSVTVKFIMDSKGMIARIVDVDRHTTDSGAQACMSAITDRAPYGDWTDDMKAILGDQQEMAFTFYYQ